ncbi:hypothetical protein B0H17DRAFT_1217512 [Mycena rosella]|uniref:Uncharacterized protein n=1 Tax=Mycena rosella TaxID=1033263 RepID=A0AAD7BXZ5_MYCRO|nr:hypothetical protein B0H17DRAFT_1217512 [Mycena rosella]
MQWESGGPGADYPFPRFDLGSFDLDWGPRPPREEILFAIRARRLGLSFPEDTVNVAFLELASLYLCSVGASLKHLELNCDEQLNKPRPLCSIGLGDKGIEILRRTPAIDGSLFLNQADSYLAAPLPVEHQRRAHECYRGTRRHISAAATGAPS